MGGSDIGTGVSPAIVAVASCLRIEHPDEICIQINKYIYPFCDIFHLNLLFPALYKRCMNVSVHWRWMMIHTTVMTSRIYFCDMVYHIRIHSMNKNNGLSMCTTNVAWTGAGRSMRARDADVEITFACRL